jgi:FkbM family methyltransferase
VKNYWHLAANHKRPGRFVTARLLMSTGLCRFFRIKQRGYQLRFHAANLSSQLWIDPNEREESLVFFRDYLKAGDRVVDVGANVGDTVLASSAQVGITGHVVGIEAHPRTFRFLQENIRLNGTTNVELINAAVGATSGTVRFSDDRRDDMNRVDGGSLQVRMERLDDLVTGDLPVALLKVDVEGYEKFVFDGAAQVLQRARCVHFEVSALHFRRFGYRTRDLLRLLSGRDFRLFCFTGPRILSSINTDFDTELFENLVALRDVEEFRRRAGWTVNES